MYVDVLLQRYNIIENGTSFTQCPGLVLVNWMPPGSVQMLKPGGCEATLKDNQTVSVTDDFRDQFLMRAEMTGRSWLEVQVISMHDFGFMGKLITELLGYAGKNLPIPFGASLLDKLSDGVKSGYPQVIAAGRSEVFSPGAFPSAIKIDLRAPGDVLGEMQMTPKPGDDGGNGDREVLVQKGVLNGSITLGLAKCASA
jgi:hypothetical protein